MHQAHKLLLPAAVPWPGVPAKGSRCAFLRRPARVWAGSGRSAVSAVSSAARAPLLVTFDVDGTLIHSVGPAANRLHKRAFSHAFKEVYDVTASVDEIEHHGSTDFLIILALMEYKGIKIADAIPLLPRAAEVMIDYYQKNSAEISEGLEILPGVAELLDALATRPDTVTSLVTGNLEPIGWAKMEALGLRGHFTKPLLGGFSTDYCSHSLADHSVDRAEFIRVAARKAVEAKKFKGPPRIVHFGDTPNDIKAAVAAGAVPVGLATGAFSLEQLRDAARKLGAEGTAVLLPDLTDTGRVLDAIDLVQAAGELRP